MADMCKCLSPEIECALSHEDGSRRVPWEPRGGKKKLSSRTTRESFFGKIALELGLTRQIRFSKLEIVGRVSLAQANALAKT